MKIDIIGNCARGPFDDRSHTTKRINGHIKHFKSIFLSKNLFEFAVANQVVRSQGGWQEWVKCTEVAETRKGNNLIDCGLKPS